MGRHGSCHRDFAISNRDQHKILPRFSQIVAPHRIVPKDRLCFGERASLNFHAAGRLGKPDMEFTKWMVSQYPQDIRIWLRDRGAPEKMTFEDMWTLPASELWKMGYKKCNA
jgi:hypothetical protein